MTSEIDPLKGDHPLKPSTKEPTSLLDAVDAVEKVGQISPAILITGVLIALVLFVLIAGGLIAFILAGGFGLVADLPTEPISVNFDSESAAYWQPVSVTEAVDGKLRVAHQAVFEDGHYSLYTYEPDKIFWSTAGIDLGVGHYSVDISFNYFEPGSGAGLVFLLSGEGGEESFYLFELDPNGYAWIGHCEASCVAATPLVGDGWFAADVINTGANTTNQLQVELQSTEMIFYLNSFEVGTVGNLQVTGRGDVGLLIEAGAGGRVAADFDNFRWVPNLK